MEGDLDGEIATSVKFDGVSQGKGAKRNIITRQFEGLPIQFNVNLRASFFELITTMRSLYDEAYIPSPQDVNLIDKDGKPIVPQNRQPLAPPSPALASPAPDVQPPASRNKR
jgi:Dicarboxylate transport